MVDVFKLLSDRTVVGLKQWFGPFVWSDVAEQFDTLPFLS